MRFLSQYHRHVFTVLVLVSLAWFYAITLLWQNIHTGGTPCLNEECPEYTSSTPLQTHKLCINVPFRDRFPELLLFVPHIHKFLLTSNAQLSFEILVLQQLDSLRFNRAALLNVGFYEAQRAGCDYFAMHDVDLLPLNPNITYSFPATQPHHVSAPEYHPRYHYEKFIGGILLISLEHYARVDGMSNRYWGWGLEDDEFYVRLKQSSLLPSRTSNLTTNSSNTFYHIHTAAHRPRDQAKLGAQRNVSRYRDHDSGLHNIQYRVVRRHSVSIDDFGATVVGIELKCNYSFSPWCLQPQDYVRYFGLPTTTSSARLPSSVV